MGITVAWGCLEASVSDPSEQSDVWLFDGGCVRWAASAVVDTTSGAAAAVGLSHVVTYAIQRGSPKPLFFLHKHRTESKTIGIVTNFGKPRFFECHCKSQRRAGLSRGSLRSWPGRSRTKKDAIGCIASKLLAPRPNNSLPQGLIPGQASCAKPQVCLPGKVPSLQREPRLPWSCGR